MASHGFDYDLYVVGVGSGGMRCTKFAKSKFNVAKVGGCDMPFSQLSVDQRSIIARNTVGGVGGTCVIRGCIPKKYFWYASHFAHELENSKGYGWDIEVKGHVWETLLAKKRAETERLHRVQVEKHMPNKGVDIHTGRGKIIDPHTIQISEPANITVTAQTIIIATGTTPSHIDVPGKEHCISSDHILELERCPQKLVIFGAGYIACEFACMFAAWGCETHLIYRKDIPLRGFDDDCRRFLARQFGFAGLHLHPLHTPVAVEKQEDGKLRVVVTGPEGEVVFTDVDDCMHAAGRHANTWELGLENAGVEVNANGSIKVDEISRTTCENIFAIGDVTDRMQLTPVAIQEGMVVLKNVFGGGARGIDYAKVASAIFTQPPMGTCGLTEEQALAKYPNLDVYMDGHEGGFQPAIHTFSGSKEEMMLKVLIDADTELVVGLHMVGKDSPEIMQGFACAMQLGLTKQTLYDTVAIHPTAAEEFVCIPGVDMMAPERMYRDGKLVES